MGTAAIYFGFFSSPFKELKDQKSIFIGLSNANDSQIQTRYQKFETKSDFGNMRISRQFYLGKYQLTKLILIQKNLTGDISLLTRTFFLHDPNNTFGHSTKNYLAK